MSSSSSNPSFLRSEQPTRIAAAGSGINENLPRGNRELVVELGMGDGRLLKSLAEADPDSAYIGIEVDAGECKRANERSLPPNATIVCVRCEEAIMRLDNESVDRFIAVLPDPALIDTGKVGIWSEFYKQALGKLKRGGSFRIVTELTNDLLEPVGDSEYQQWAGRLGSIFREIGFEIRSSQGGAPAEYSTRSLDQFRGDPSRIRLLTLEMGKP